MTASTSFPPRPKTTLPLLARVTNSRFVRALLSPLEKKSLGKSVESDGTRVVKTDTLTPELLRDFFSNKILAIHIPKFVSAEACDHLAGNILAENLTNWNVYDLKNAYATSDVNVLGEPFNMANKTDESWQHYFSNAEIIAEKIRKLASPHPSPFDSCQQLINQIWKPGITVRKYKGHSMTAGLSRVMYDKDVARIDAPLGCHVDSPPLLSEKAGRYSVNIYLKQATSGGHLYIWNPKITTLFSALKNWSMIKNFFLESNYLNEEIQMRFQKLLPPPILIEAGQGDLIMINTGRPHAVVPFQGGPRVSLQAFLTYKRGKPIGIWA